MRKWKPVSFVPTIAILLCSCHTYRYIYSPPPPNIPYFQQKGDSKLTAYYSGGFDDDGKKNLNEGFDLQAAYAITNHFAIAGAYSNRSEKDTYPYAAHSAYNLNIFDSSVVDYKRSTAEISAGWFTPINRKKTITYNLYGGLGLGKFSMQDNGLDSAGASYTRYHQNNISKAFIEGGFNFMVTSFFQFSCTGRFSWVHYGSNISSYTNKELQYFYLDKIADRTLFFYEPSISMRLCLNDWLKVDFVQTICSSLPENYPHVRGLMGSVGLTVDLSKIKKSKK